MENFVMPLLGGALIGIAVSLMLYFNGRVTGVSGIVSGALARPNSDQSWRILFILGLISGGVVLRIVLPQSLVSGIQTPTVWLVIAGLLVGFGTVMGSGCTSGHGICGLSRLSPRSIVATLLFMSFGVFSATIFRILIGGG